MTQTSLPPTPSVSDHHAHRPSIDALMAAWINAHGLFRRVMDPYFASFGITGAQWAILFTLHKAEAEGLVELHMAELGDRLIVRPPSVTTVVQRTVRMGYLVDRRSPSDQRAKCVALTPAGRALVHRVIEQRSAQLDRLFGAFDDAERGALTALLTKFGAHLSTLVEAGPAPAAVAADRN